MIGIAGPHITFSAAIFAHVLVSQRLTGYIFLGPHTDEREHDAARRIALMIRALNKLRTSLDKYYETLIPEDQQDVHDAKRRRLQEGIARPRRSANAIQGKAPTFSTFFKDGNKYELEYLDRLDHEHPHKSVFLAHATRADSDNVDTSLVVVKFTRTYGKRGHQLLANEHPPLAPTLWYCEPVQELGGLWMVVMDHAKSHGAL